MYVYKPFANKPDTMVEFEDLENCIPVNQVSSASSMEESSQEKKVATTQSNKRIEYSKHFADFLESIGKNTTHHIDQPVCLMIKDLKLIEFSDDMERCKIFGYDCKSVMIYGFLIPGSIRNDTNRLRIYTIDDGTDTIDVFYKHASEENVRDRNTIQTIIETLENSQPADDQDVQMNNDMKMIGNIVKERCDAASNYFKLHSKCFVIGGPFLTFGQKRCIYAYHIYLDSKQSNTNEMAWKLNLANIYQTKYANYIEW